MDRNTQWYDKNNCAKIMEDNTMMNKLDIMNNWFSEKIAECEMKGSALRADDRKDEANFEKIAANVYGIFHTVLSVAVETCKEDEEAVKTFFLCRTAQIPSNWITSYQQAKAHGDSGKMHIESIKLEVVKEITDTFEKIWKEERI